MTSNIYDAAVALSQFQRFRLRCGGTSIDAFQSMSLERGLNRAVSSARLSIANAWNHIGYQAAQAQLGSGARVELLTDLDTLILTGFIDRRNDRGNEATLDVNLELASWTAQAADSSVQIDGYQLKDVMFSTACQVLCNQTNVRVAFGPGVRSDEILQKVQIQPGDTAISVIERLCRVRGYTLTDRADGTLVVVGGALGGAVNFSLPGNVSQYEMNANIRDQYSECVIVGSQSSLELNDEQETVSVAGYATMTLDLDRKIVIQAKGELNASLASVRAQHELQRRVASAMKMTITCPALRLVEVGMKARVRLDPVSIDDEYLVEGVRWSLGEKQGEQTQVTLVPVGAYKAFPPTLVQRPTPKVETSQRSYLRDGVVSE